MRTATTGEQAVLSGRYSGQYLRVEIQDELGDWVDYSDYIDLDRQDRAEVRKTQDDRIAQFTVEVERSGPDGSLSPLINSDIDLGRGIRIYGARVAAGTSPVSGDFKLLCDGRIDRWEASSDPIVLTGRDNAGILVDRWIEEDTEYGSESGDNVEDVIQAIIDAWADGLFTVVVEPGSGILTTPFVIPTYTQEKMAVWDACQRLLEDTGYVMEYRWSDSAGAFQMLILEPRRDITTPEWTFGPDDYYEVTKLDANLLEVRNVWSGRYRDSGTGEREHIEVEDEVSTARFDIRLWAEIEEGDDSPIDTAAEMTTLLNAALSDTSMPNAEHEIDPDLFWPVQIGDYYRHSPNAVHYDANQDFAVAAYTHVFEGGKATTRILTRGKPAGRPNSWLRRLGLSAAPPATLIVTLDIDGNDLYMSWFATAPVAQVRYLVDEEDAPTPAEVAGSTDVDATATGVLIHSFDPEGDPVQVVYVGWRGETLAGAPATEVSVRPATYSVAGGMRPTVELTYLGRTTDGKEKWLAVAAGAKATVALYLRTYTGSPPAYDRTPGSGYSTDPLVVPFSFEHPGDGDPNVIIEAYAEDEDGIVGKVVRKESDSDTFPTGDIDLTSDTENEVYFTAKAVDTDSLGWRFRFAVGAKGSDAYADPAFSDVATDEVSGSTFGVQTKVSAVAAAISALKDDQEIFVSGYMFNTATTTAAAQGAAVKSALIRRSIPAGFMRNALKSVWLDPVTQINAGPPDTVQNNVWLYFQAFSEDVKSIEYEIYKNGSYLANNYTDQPASAPEGRAQALADASLTGGTVTYECVCTPYDAIGGAAGGGNAGPTISTGVLTYEGQARGVDGSDPNTMHKGVVFTFKSGLKVNSSLEVELRRTLSMSDPSGTPEDGEDWVKYS